MKNFPETDQASKPLGVFASKSVSLSAWQCRPTLAASLPSRLAASNAIFASNQFRCWAGKPNLQNFCIQYFSGIQFFTCFTHFYNSKQASNCTYRHTCQKDSWVLFTKF